MSFFENFIGRKIFATTVLGVLIFGSLSQAHARCFDLARLLGLKNSHVQMGQLKLSTLLAEGKDPRRVFAKFLKQRQSDLPRLFSVAERDLDIDLANRLPDLFNLTNLQASPKAPSEITLSDLADTLSERRLEFIKMASRDPNATAFPMWSRSAWRRTRPILYGLLGAALIFPAYGIFGARFAAYFENPTANNRMDGYASQHAKDFGDRAPLNKFSTAQEREWWEIFLRTQGSKNWLLQSSSDKVIYVPGNIASIQRALVDARDHLKNPELVRNWLRSLYYMQIDHADFLNSSRGEPSRKIIEQIFTEFDREGLRAHWEAETTSLDSAR